MDAIRKLVYTENIEIRWGDMDAMGHVNNTLYFRYIEQVRIDWLRSLGNSVTVAEEEGPVIITATCTFRKALTFPGTVEARMYLGDVGRSSVMSYYELWMNGELYADGEAKIVWTDIKAAKSIPLPPAVLALLA